MKNLLLLEHGETCKRGRTQRLGTPRNVRRESLGNGRHQPQNDTGRRYVGRLSKNHRLILGGIRRIEKRQRKGWGEAKEGKPGAESNRVR